MSVPVDLITFSITTRQIQTPPLNYHNYIDEEILKLGNLCGIFCTKTPQKKNNSINDLGSGSPYALYM